MDNRFRRTGLLRALILCAAAMLPGQATASSKAQPGRPDCARLTGLRLAKVEITSAVLAPAGQEVSAAPTVSSRQTVTLAAHCRVNAVARPTRDSEIGIEIWLPVEGWNGKYQQVGNGGWAGAIHHAPLADALRRGYAAAATDNGHTGGLTDDGRGVRSAAFAIGHPEKLIDFGYRALSQTHDVALAVIQAFYGREAARSYFVGCSDGGREALMVAQRFPDAFDGVLAGNPGNDWSRWGAGLVWAQQAQLADAPGVIPTTKRSIIQSAVMAACDGIDGVVDGLITDPRACRFDPAVLLCGGAERADCLTADQVATLRKLYQGPRNPRTGEQIYPGHPPGVEGALIAPVQPGAFSYGASYFGQVVFERPDWDFRTLDFDRDIAVSDRKSAPMVDATSPDLRAFRARGGKLIHYHGWADGLMPAERSIQYHDAVAAFMAQYPDPRNAGPKAVDSFYRLFLVPGMGHCYGGDGPTTIAPINMAAADPQYDLVLALERWVENDVAPKQFIGVGNALLDPSKTMTRPICAYPLAPRYRGAGDSNDAANFACAAPTTLETP